MKRFFLICLLLGGCQIPLTDGSPAVTVRLGRTDFHALSPSRKTSDVNHITITIYDTPGNTVRAVHQVTGSATAATFRNLPNGTYYATAEAFSSANDSTSITQGGPQSSANTVTVASPAVSYQPSSATGLSVALNLLDGTGGSPGVTVTTGLAPLSYHAWLRNGSGALLAPYVSVTPTFHFLQIPDGTFQVVASLAVNSTTSTPSRCSAEQLAFMDGVSTPAGGFTVSLPGQIQSVASSSTSPGGISGAVGVAPDGTDVIIADTSHHRICRLSGSTMTVLAGGGVAGFSGDGGAATAAQLDTPKGIAVAADGTIYIADTGNGRIRQIRNGIITTVAGKNATGFGGDGGAATAAKLDTPSAVAVASSSPLSLYIADTANHRVRWISGTTITTVAGTGLTSVLASPQGLALAANGTLYIADTGNHRVRQLSGNTLTTVAGTGTSGSSGDGGSATAAKLNGPTGLAFGPAADLFIADTGNHRIRRIEGTTITLVSGSTLGSTGDGLAASAAKLNAPLGLATAASGDLYVADSGNSRIRLVR